MEKSDKITAEQNKTNQPGEDMRVEWFGADGALMLLYIVLAGIYTYGILNRIDFIVGILAPVIAFGITAMIFCRYCFEVVSFAKKSKKSKDTH